MTHISFFGLITGLFMSFSSMAQSGIMRCLVYEKLGTQKTSYTFDIPSRTNHTVHYYDYARLIPNFYIRASGMTGGGAKFLHLDLEDLTTKQSALTKVKSSGNIYLGTRERSIEMGCEII